MRRSLVGLALLTALAASPAYGQGLRGGAGGFNVTRRVYFDSVVHEQTGILVGGSGALRLGPLRIGVNGVMGTLKAEEGTAAAPEVKVRSTTVRAAIVASPGVELGVQAAARRFEADAGVTLWRLVGAAAHLEPGLGRPGLRAVVDVAVLPASTVVDGPKVKVALEGQVGVVLEPPRSVLRLELGYRFERYDLEAGTLSGERYEQYAGLIAGIGIRLGR